MSDKTYENLFGTQVKISALGFGSDGGLYTPTENGFKDWSGAEFKETMFPRSTPSSSPTYVREKTPEEILKDQEDRRRAKEFVENVFKYGFLGLIWIPYKIAESVFEKSNPGSPRNPAKAFAAAAGVFAIAVGGVAITQELDKQATEKKYPALSISMDDHGRLYDGRGADGAAARKQAQHACKTMEENTDCKTLKTISLRDDFCWKVTDIGADYEITPYKHSKGDLREMRDFDKLSRFYSHPGRNILPEQTVYFCSNINTQASLKAEM